MTALECNDDSDYEYESDKEQIHEEITIQTQTIPENSFINDILFTLYNDFILPWSIDESNNLDIVTNLSGLLNFIENYSKNNKNSKLKIVYHGTTTEAIESIRETMFIVPDNKRVKIRNGKEYGKGIYCSPSIKVANGYSTNNKLIVCLLAPGRVNKKYPYINSDEYDTNYCQTTEIVCTFDSKNICPLFIVNKNEVDKIKNYTEIISGFITNVFELTSERQF